MSSSVWTDVLISPRAGEAQEEVSDLLTVEEEMTATEMLRRLDFEEKHSRASVHSSCNTGTNTVTEESD